MPFKPCKACGCSEIKFIDTIVCNDWSCKVRCKCTNCGYESPEATSYDLAYEYWNNTNKEPAK